MNLAFLILIMLIGYGVAFFFILRALLVGISFSHGDVPYVPIDRSEMILAIKALNLSKGDRFVDIGSGDGRVVVYVAKKYPEIECVGVELNSLLILWSRFIAWVLRLNNVKFIRADALEFEVSSFNKLFIYLTLDLVTPLVSRMLLELKPGSLVVSCLFGFGGIVQNGVESVGRKGTELWRV